MNSALINTLRILNQLLTAGIAITAFSLLVYALTFNLRDRVARSFALILVCVVVVFTSDAIGSVSDAPFTLQFWLRLESAVDGGRVRSELRHRINALLEGAGIVLAFPQRDVHLDAQRPLEVKVVHVPSPADPGRSGLELGADIAGTASHK